MLCYDLRIFRLGIILATAFCLLVPAAINGQGDTVLQLREVEVTAQRLDLTDIGKHTDEIDSHNLAVVHYDNLASLLSMQTPLFVRSYGTGTLATLGIRGGSASHTQLMWNGIPIRNPMLGLVDLALIPSAFIDQAAIHYGGHGAAFGSGAVGGLISLSNKPISQKDEINVHISAGSWDRRIGELKLDYGLKNIRFSTRIFSQFAENNYRYRLDTGLPERNQIHNQIKNEGLLQELFVPVTTRQHIIARLWLQNTDRQIPPTSTQTTSKSAEQDQSLRASVQWARNGDKWNWQLKTAWLNEKIDFQDSLIQLYTHNQFETWLAEGETSFYIGPEFSFAGGLYTEIVKAKSANYLAGTSRYQHAVFSSLRFVKADWLLRAQIREEVTDGSWSPFLIDFSVEWSGLKAIAIKSSLSRNYRVPTLNDLYWRPGGNPDLQPEQGWTIESGLYYTNAGKKFNLNSSLTAYSRTIDQWIMWMPPVKDISNYWSPINIAEVHSQGFEARGNVVYVTRDWNFNVNAGLDLTWSKFGTPLPDFMIEEGEQLFYVPIENLLTGIKVNKAPWSGYYNHHWYGSSSGINDDVDAGNIGSAGISFQLPPSNWSGALYLQADNIWNVPYRIMERRPMPGRSFVGGIRISVIR